MYPTENTVYIYTVYVYIHQNYYLPIGYYIYRDPINNNSYISIAGKTQVGVKIDEDSLKILDELPSSAVEMQVKSKVSIEIFVRINFSIRCIRYHDTAAADLELSSMAKLSQVS